MERDDWLKQIRDKTEELYDHFSPLYWVRWGLHPSETHREYLQKFLERVAPHSTLLSAACGAGLYDGILMEAGHSVMGIDQSEGMLARARQHLPGVRYEKVGLQEMDFQEAFEGVICIDAMEHICPEDWPGIMRRFGEALKPDGVLYITLDIGDTNMLESAYEKAKSQGLPVVFGELVDEVDTAYESVKAVGIFEVPGDIADKSVYHYYPSFEQLRTWMGAAGLVIEAEGTGDGYQHFVVRKKDLFTNHKVAHEAIEIQGDANDQ